MKGEDIVQKCKAWYKAGGGDGALPRKKMRQFYPERPLKTGSESISKESLLPATPSVLLENKKDAFSATLQQLCSERPIVVIRGIAGALKLDLGLFSTKALVERCPSHPVEVVTQMKQKVDENWDSSLSKQVWHCESKPSLSSLKTYGAYQTTTFQEGLKEEGDKGSNIFKVDHDEVKTEDGRRVRKQQNLIKFAHFVDLSDMSLWRTQLMELLKLPTWARVVSGGNILSHVGYTIPGVNTLGLEMGVPQARLTARQDRNSFCSVHINIGPGDCEWFAVPHKYWQSMVMLCEKNGVDFNDSTWWPNMKDLVDEEIPVYRFYQQPGDMVWINPGCIYWVQMVGWNNSIKWNVGPLTKDQYRTAIDKYEWNRMQFVKSVVPMEHLSWNLARNIRLVDETLFCEIKTVILQSLQRHILIKENLAANGIEAKLQPKKRNAKAVLCHHCNCEVFGLTFVEEIDEEPVASCYTCARMKTKALKDFICIEEFGLKELLSTYDHFQLNAPATPTGNSISPAIFGLPSVGNFLGFRDGT